MNNFVLVYYGILTILTQLVVFRELSVLFYGNELFLGTFLSSWLFWTGLGSMFVRRLVKRDLPAAEYFSYGMLAVAVLFPSMILAIRATKSAFAFGEFIGPVATVLYTFGIMSVLCFVTGGEFSLACAAASAKFKNASALGRVYMYESLGAVMGGAAFTYLLIGYVPTFTIALCLSLGCVAISLIVPGKKPPVSGILPAAVVLVALFAGFCAEPRINRLEWKQYQFVGQKEARNGTISLAGMGSIKNIFADGMLSASFPNPESYEPVAHWSLLACARPDRILIIGDASLGLIREAVKHKPEKIDFVVPDSSFIDIAGSYLESEDISVLRSNVVETHFADARNFVRDNKDKYDAVILNIQDVPNLKTNRLYTKEFYERIKMALKPGGILAVSVASSENYLSAATRAFNSSVYRTLKSVFNTVEVLPGDAVMFLSGSEAIDMRKETILGRFSRRGLSDQYFIPSYIEYKLEPLRRADLARSLEDAPGIEINRDFMPTTCYYFTGYWLNKFASPVGCLAAVLICIAVLAAAFRNRRSFLGMADRKEAVLIFILGFAGMLTELMLLLGYQVVSGFVYWQMGVLFASFMSGLFIGSLLGNALKEFSGRIHFSCLAALSLLFAAISISAAYILPYLAGLSTVMNILVFTALLVSTGTVIGAAFIVAGLASGGDEIMARAGNLYAADLWGAALGALLATNIIVPVFGITGSLYLSAFIAASGLSVFFMLPRGER